MDSAGGIGTDRSNGIILGSWDHENTASLIKELEETVETAEKKCIALMLELNNYKRYYEEHGCKGDHVVAVQLKKKKSNKHKVIYSLSDNGLSQKSSIIDEDRIFYEKIRNKILEVNDEITYANLKMGLKDSNFLFPTEEFKENLKMNAELYNGKNLSPVISLESQKFEDFCNDQFKSTKSDPVLRENDKNQLLKKYDYSKITKGELELYKSLSNKNIIMSRDYQVDDDSLSSLIKSPTKFRSKSLPQNCASAQKNEVQVSVSEQICNEDYKIKDLKSYDLRKNSEVVVDDGQNLRRRKKFNKKNSKNSIPFTVCSSTSKSFNIGVNIQRCMSLIKEKKIKPTTSATIEVSVPDKCMQAISNLLEAASKSKEVLASKRNLKGNSLKDESNSQFTKAVDLMFNDANLMDLKESGQTDEQINRQRDLRKQRFKYTAIEKEKNKGVCCKKEKKTKGCKSLSQGDSSRPNNFQEELKTELTRIHDDFTSLFRKYALLREQISKNLLSKSEINAALDMRAMEYADLINLYGQLLTSKQNLKYENSQSSQPEIPPTSTVTLTKVLRQVQNLQEEIKQIN